MVRRRLQLTRRALIASAGANLAGASLAGASLAGASLFAGDDAHAFGDENAFNPRILLTGTTEWKGVRTSAPLRWSQAVMARTSAPARLKPTTVRADAPELLAEPFAIWAAHEVPAPLTRSEVQGLRRFLGLGGVLLVDEMNPESGEFLVAARRELARLLPHASPIEIDDNNVVFRTFYYLDEATGRLQKNKKFRAILRRGDVQVIFSANDLLGALARDAGGVFPLEVRPGGRRQRELSVRLAVNIAMYVLCSDYKDDQVHAPFLMRRRAP